MKTAVCHPSPAPDGYRAGGSVYLAVGAFTGISIAGLVVRVSCVYEPEPTRNQTIDEIANLG